MSELKISLIEKFNAGLYTTQLIKAESYRNSAICKTVFSYISRSIYTTDNNISHNDRISILEYISSYNLKNKTNYFKHSEGIHRAPKGFFKSNDIDIEEVTLDILILDSLMSDLKNLSKEEVANKIKENVNKNFDISILELISGNLPKYDPILKYNTNLDFGIMESEQFLRNLSNVFLENKNKSYQVYIDKLNTIFNQDYSEIQIFYKKYLKEFHDQIKKSIFRDTKTVLEESNLKFDISLEKYIKTNYIKISLLDDRIFNLPKVGNVNFKEILEEKKSNTINILSTENNGAEFFVKEIISELPENDYIKYILNLTNDDYRSTIKNLELSIKYKKPILLIIYGFNNEKYNLDQILLDKIKNDSNNLIINIFFNKDELKQLNIKDDYIVFNLFEIHNDNYKYHSFVKNVYTQMIYDACSEKSYNNISSLYYSYYKNMIKNLENSFKEYKKDELYVDLQKIAYLTKEDKVLNLTHLGFKQISTLIERYLKQINWLIDLDEEGNISFVNDTYKSFFISRYLTSNINEFKNIRSDKKDFEKISIFLADSIPTEDFILQYPDLFEKILENVRRFKYEDSHKNLIQDLEKIDISNTKILKEMAKYYYYQTNYEKSIEETLKIIKIENNQEIKNSDLIAELYNLLASCLFDLNLNEQAEEICKEALELDSKEYKAKILGTLGRIYLRKKDFKQAENMFIEKSKCHNVNSLDGLRDKSDLLLVKILKDSKKVNKSTLEDYFKQTKEIENEYINKFSDLNPKYNSMYAWMNLSHLIQGLSSNNESREFLMIKELSNNTINKEAQAIINLNLGIYFTKLDHTYESPETYINTSLDIFENKLLSSYYAYKCSIYLNQKDSSLLDRINTHYSKLKKQSETIKELFNNQDIIKLKNISFDIGISEITSIKELNNYKNNTKIDLII